MKRIALALAAVLVALGVGLVAWGAFLPRAHRVSSQVAIPRVPAEVWSVLRDLGSMPRWWPEVRESTRVDAVGGRERWRQVIGGFELVIEVVEDVPPQRLVTEVVTREGALFGGRWMYILQPEAAGTLVRITENGWIAPWPFRAIARLSGYHTSLDECLANLSRHFGADARPTHVEEAQR